MLAGIDPALYRFQVHNAPAGNRELDDWMKETGAVLVINGSYFTRYVLALWLSLRFWDCFWF